MSKMDALRAMREARYAEMTSRAGAPAKARPRAVRAEPVAPAADAATDGLCGHRNMSGRTCTREQGHAAKSHRYS
jgi:hypothetical protein